MNTLLLAALMSMSVTASAFDIEGVVAQAVKFHAHEIKIEAQITNEEAKQLFYSLEDAGFKVTFTFKQDKNNHITRIYKLHSINGN